MSLFRSKMDTPNKIEFCYPLKYLSKIFMLCLSDTDLYKNTARNPHKKPARLLQLRHRNHANPYRNQGLCICHYQKPLGYQSSSLSLTKASANASNTNDMSPKNDLGQFCCKTKQIKHISRMSNLPNFFSCLDLKISFSLAEYWRLGTKSTRVMARYTLNTP